MSQHTSTANPFSPKPSQGNEAAPSYDSHILDEPYQLSSPPLHQAPSQPPALTQGPLSPTSNSDIRGNRRTPPPHFTSVAGSSTQQPPSENENQPPKPAASSNLPPQQTPDELAALQSASSDAFPDFLTLDRDLIFPPPPSQALYSLTFALSSTGTANTLRRSFPTILRPDGTQRSSISDKDLYRIRRDPISRTSFSIDGLRRSTYPGTLILSRRRNLLKGTYWECVAEKTGELLVRSKGEEWIDGLGRVVGREAGGVCLSRKKRKEMERDNARKAMGEAVQWKAPVLELVGVGRGRAGGEGGEGEERIRDLLVACWVGKCWYAERVGAMVEPKAGEYMSNVWKKRTQLGAGSLFF